MFDLLTTGAMTDEIDQTLVGGKIQRIGLRDRSTLVAEVYAEHRRHYLVASIHDPNPFCLISSSTVSVDTEAITPFSLLLRKHLRGGRIVAVEQPYLDRIIRLSIAKRVEPHNSDERPSGPMRTSRPEDEGQIDFGPIVTTDLMLEIMGRRSNVVMVSETGMILDSLKRVDRQMSPARQILPNIDYVLPPKPSKLDPLTCSPEELFSACQETETKRTLSAALVAVLAGFSPQMASEVVFRVFGDVKANVTLMDADAARAISHECRELLTPLASADWSPRIYRDDQGGVKAAAAVEHRWLAARYEDHPDRSMSACLEQWHADPRINERHAERKSRLLNSIGEQRRRTESKLENLRGESERTSDRDRYRRWGEAIFASLHELQPRQESFEWEGERIALDPGTSHVDLAQRYFARYRRDQRGEIRLEDVLSETEADLAMLDQMTALVQVAETFDEIEQLRKEWESVNAPPPDPNARRRRPDTPKLSRPLLDSDGNAIYVGRTAKQNEAVTFGIGSRDDLWLHARGVPGAHVLIKRADREKPVPQETLAAAASIAAWYSGAKNETSALVDVCLRKDVKRVKGGRPGLGDLFERNSRTRDSSIHRASRNTITRGSVPRLGRGFERCFFFE